MEEQLKWAGFGFGPDCVLHNRRSVLHVACVSFRKIEG